MNKSPLALYRQASRLFNTGNRRIDQHNRRQWVISVMHLGNRWLLATPRGRLCA